MDRYNQYRFFIVIALLSLISIVLGLCIIVTMGPEISRELSEIDINFNNISGVETKRGEEIGTFLVTKVVDGDTFWIDYNGTREKVRLIGIDAPESKDPNSPVECFSQEASDYLHSLLNAKYVRIAYDPSQGERDRYGRLLVYAWVGEVFINETLIREGYAFEYTYNVPYVYQDAFRESEQYARSMKVGLWGKTCSHY